MVRARIPIRLQVDKQSPIPIRRQLTEQLKHVIETGGVPPDQALPSIRELAGFLGINPNTIARVMEDLKRSEYVAARRGKGVFVAPAPPARRSPVRRQGFLRDVVIRAAALGMTADDLAVGVLSLAGVRPAAVQGTVEVLLVECSPPELDFFARALEAHLPIRVDKVLLGELATAVGRRKSAARWGAAVTSFCHLPAVERSLRGMGIPVIALLAEAHLRTLRAVVDLGGQAVSADDRLYLTSHFPTLIVWGTRDRVIPVRHARDAHAAIPRSRLEIFEDVGHYPHCDAPERFGAVLADFIASTEPARLHSWREVLQAPTAGRQRAAADG